MKIGIITAVCEQDFHLVETFMCEAKRLGYDVAIYADRLSKENLEKLKRPGVVFIHDNRTEKFANDVRRIPLKYLDKNGYDLAIQMDIDETFELDFKQNFKFIEDSIDNFDLAACPMVTTFKQGGELFRRVGKYFSIGRNAMRERVYNLRRSDFDYVGATTCFAYPMINGEINRKSNTLLSDATTVHWGFSSDEIIAAHQEKWNKVYADLYGYVPEDKKTWKHMLTIQKKLIPLEDIYYKHLCL